MPPVPERTGEKQSSEADMGSVECPTAGNTWKDRPTPGCKRHICTYLYHRLLAEGTLSYACKVSRRWTITWSASQPATGLIGWLLGIYVLMSTQADRGDHPSECNLPSLNFFMGPCFRVFCSCFSRTNSMVLVLRYFAPVSVEQTMISGHISPLNSY